ncbi:MAG: hypothetical protein ABR586_09195 [Thermoplasmatota archaeon]
MGDVVEDVVGAVVDTVKDAVDTLLDGAKGIVDGVVDWVALHAPAPIVLVADFIGGAVSGAISGIRAVFDDVLQVVKDVVGVAAAVLRLDFAAVIQAIANLGLDVLRLFIDAVRLGTGLAMVGGIVQAVQRNALRTFVSDLVNETFKDDDTKRNAIRKAIGLDGGTFGFRLPANHRVLMFDSANTPLWRLHQDGIMDLMALAHLGSFDTFQVAGRGRSVVKVVNDDGSERLRPANRYDINQYVDSNGAKGRLRVYALSRQAVSEHLRHTTEKAKQLAVLVAWDQGLRFSWFRDSAHHEATSSTEFAFDADTLGAYLIDQKLRTPARDDNCAMMALAGFNLFMQDPKSGKPSRILGVTSGRGIEEGNDSTPCATRGRDDGCCVTVQSFTPPRADTQAKAQGAGIFYTDGWPQTLLGYVAPHETGHYVGLCHFGHDGAQNIMVTLEPEANVSLASWGLFWYAIDGEPHFTPSDGRNVWRFILDQLLTCVAPAERSSSGLHSGRLNG